jgi:hypothetical protein
VTLTPVELRGGRWYKREDAHRIDPPGVNGSKLRACQHLIGQAAARGDIMTVVSAQSVLSPQAAMSAVVARDFGLECEIIVGATTPEKAVRHPSIRIAVDAGATVRAIPVAYNTALQRAALEAAQEPGVWRMPYGITTPPDAGREEIEAFLRVGAPQTANLPDEVETLVLPFGSSNTACGVLYGLHDARPAALRDIYLMEIGPDRRTWAANRLAAVGRGMHIPGVNLHFLTLHDVWASYGDRMKESLDGINFHPTYEGKMVRWLNLVKPEWWTRRDGTTCFWIVGGEFA